MSILVLHPHSNPNQRLGVYEGMNVPEIEKDPPEGVHADRLDQPLDQSRIENCQTTMTWLREVANKLIRFKVAMGQSNRENWQKLERRLSLDQMCT